MPVITITTPIEDERLQVEWDLSYYYEFDEFNDWRRYDSVENIKSVEYLAFDKVGFDMTDKFLNDYKLKSLLEQALLDAVEFENEKELGATVGEHQFGIVNKDAQEEMETAMESHYNESREFDL